MMKTNTDSGADINAVLKYNKILLYSNDIYIYIYIHTHTLTHTGVAAMLVDVGQIFNGLGKINVAIACPPIRSLWFQLVNDGE